MGKKIDISGVVFGRLTVVSESEKRKGRTSWNCVCECGNKFIAITQRLRNGQTTSCGCARVDFASSLGKGAATHRMSNSGIYSSWSSMKTRCSNKNHVAYEQYGGRGISVCDRWNVFEYFLADMGEKPYGCSIDRIDTDGNYEPGNCRWATAKEQGRNRRNNHMFNGMCIAEISERDGIKYTTARERVKRIERKSNAVNL